MRVTLNPAIYKPSMKAASKYDADIKQMLGQFAISQKAKVPALSLMKGINPNNNAVFDTFNRVDDVARQINFVKSRESWDACLQEEIGEFRMARRDYERDKTPQNYDHMQEEMGDIFFTLASIAKDSGIDPKEAFKSTNRKFYNRINYMERLASADGLDLKTCTDDERRAMWNFAKRRLYDAQTLYYQA